MVDKETIGCCYHPHENLAKALAGTLAKCVISMLNKLSTIAPTSDS